MKTSRLRKERLLTDNREVSDYGYKKLPGGIDPRELQQTRGLDERFLSFLQGPEYQIDFAQRVGLMMNDPQLNSAAARLKLICSCPSLIPSCAFCRESEWSSGSRYEVWIMASPALYPTDLHPSAWISPPNTLIDIS